MRTTHVLLPFSVGHNLNVHMKSVHNKNADGTEVEGGKLKCEKCDYETGSLSMMTAHKRWAQLHGECKKRVYCK